MRKKNAQVEYDIMISRGLSVIVIFCIWLICNFSGKIVFGHDPY